MWLLDRMLRKAIIRICKARMRSRGVKSSPVDQRKRGTKRRMPSSAGSVTPRRNWTMGL